MILTYPHYLDQTQIIGLEGILNYHGEIKSSILLGLSDTSDLLLGLSDIVG